MPGSPPVVHAAQLLSAHPVPSGADTVNCWLTSGLAYPYQVPERPATVGIDVSHVAKLSMIFGSMSREFYLKEHDPERWVVQGPMSPPARGMADAD